MPGRQSGLKGPVVIKFASVCCFAACILGLALSVVKGPDARAKKLTHAGSVYFENARDTNMQGEAVDYLLGLSKNSLLKAASLNVYDPEVWMALSSVLEVQGNFLRAEQARDIAMKLNAEPDLNALPEMKMAYGFQLTSIQPENREN